jgi:hypothetical protein
LIKLSIQRIQIAHPEIEAFKHLTEFSMLPDDRFTKTRRHLIFWMQHCILFMRLQFSFWPETSSFRQECRGPEPWWVSVRLFKCLIHDLWQPKACHSWTLDSCRAILPGTLWAGLFSGGNLAADA